MSEMPGKTMKIILLSAVAVFAFGATVAKAFDSPVAGAAVAKCADEPGLKGPYVPDATVAENVFKAINKVRPSKPSDDYQFKITAEDKGTYWDVQSHTLARQADGTYQALAGAGNWMDIDKCRATVLKAGTSR